MERALVCPQCGAPLTVSIFAPKAVCSYCGATIQLDESVVPVERFHEAFRLWNSPQSYLISNWLSLENRHWAIEESIGHGEIADVYRGRRARWPTELVVLKILRDERDVHLLDKEWETLQTLQRSTAPGAEVFVRLLPQPVDHGRVTGGLYAGRRVNIFRWESGFLYSLEAVIQAYPRGIPPQSSIWVWRRILELLSFIHASGMVHGAILPPHILIQKNEHGARLIGFSHAGRIGDELPAAPKDAALFYPSRVQFPLRLTPLLDIVMSARCMFTALGGDLNSQSLPACVPGPLAEIVQRLAYLSPDDARAENAWDLREKLGEIARRVFGPPQFCPIVMPS